MQTPEGSPTIDGRIQSNRRGPLTPEGSPKSSRGSKTRGSHTRHASNPTPEGSHTISRNTATIYANRSPQITETPLTPEGSPKNSRGSKTRGLHILRIRIQPKPTPNPHTTSG